MIRAEAHSDDFKHTAKFDATPWFEQVTVEEIIELAECGWGGDQPADQVAQFFDGETGYEGVTSMFENKDGGFECHVHEADVFAWLASNRPSVLGAVAEALGENPDDLRRPNSSAPHWDEDTSWKGDYNAAPAAPQP